MSNPPKSPSSTTPHSNSVDLASLARQFHHYEAFDALEYSRIETENGINWASLWEKQVISRAVQIALIDADSATEYSYLALDRLADAVAHWALQNHFPERIGLFQLNNVALVATLLGLAKVGRHAVVFHNNEDPLRVQKLCKRLGVKSIIGSTIPGVASLSGENIVNMPWPGPISATFRQHVQADDAAAILFTSGVRGDSRPIYCSHRRLISSVICQSQRLQMTAKDRCYLTTGLTHAEGLIMGLATCFHMGATAVTATNIQNDDTTWLQQLQDTQCTMLQYSGGFWRHAIAGLSSASTENNGAISHTLNTVFGSGLTTELHHSVVKHFNIKRVIEYYWAADMPDMPLFNWSSRPGACGYIPPAHPSAEDIILLNAEGKIVAEGEPGEALLRIRDKRFKRYLDSKSHNNNVATNVLTPGDRWWRSGDILSRNADGFFQFIKHAYTESEWEQDIICLARVEQALNDIGQFKEVAVYTAPVPAYDHPAIMASIVPSCSVFDLDLEEILMCLQSTLPSTWVPRLLRISSKPHSKTANFKIPTAELSSKSFFFIEEADHFVLENGIYQLIDLEKLRQFDENQVELGFGGKEFGIEIPTLVEAI